MRSSLVLALALAVLAQPSGRSPKAISVDLDGVVHPVTAEIVAGAVAQAKAAQASVLILHLNTPGGLMDAMRDTISEIAASPVPVVTYVAPSGGRAASAGFFILEAGDLAAMAPGTNTGAAHPVEMGGGDIGPTMKEKVENDAAAYMRSIANRRGRNSAVAETAVRESKSFTETEALSQNLIDLISPSDQALLKSMDGRTVIRFDGKTQVLHTAGAEIVEYQQTLRQKVISSIADPNIALILLVIGALCIYVEFTHPGMVAPGVAGAILVLLGLSALSVLPINWLGVALLAVAIALFVLEAKLAAHGVLAVGAAIAMLLGSVLLIDSPMPEMRIHWITAVSVTLPFSVITTMLLGLAMRARRNKRATGAEGMIGEIGCAVTELAPDGKVFVHGEYWNAAATGPVNAGGRVKITKIDQLKLTVEPVPDGPGGEK